MSPIQSRRPHKKGNETACNVDSKIPMKIPLHYLKRLPANAKSCLIILFTLAFLEDCSGSQSRWLHVCRVENIYIYIDILYLDMQLKIKHQYKKDN